MTTETPIISSISGGNINPIRNDKKNNSDLNKDQRKRNFVFHSDKIENLQLHENVPNSPRTTTWNKLSSRLLNWLFCGPCITFLGTSTTFHRMILTTITLSVTILLVGSPILFLISATPAISQNHQIDDCGSTDDCIRSGILPISSVPECREEICVNASRNIQSRINFSYDACTDFKNFCCSHVQDNVHAFKTPQEIVDDQMMNLIKDNTTNGVYRKLGRLYESCLRQEINSSTIRLVVEELGGILVGPNALGPSNPSMSFSKLLSKFGAPMPLLDVYFDLSYGKKPKIIMMIDVPSDIRKVLPNPVRWKVPRAPIFKIEQKLPKLFDTIVDQLLPNSLNDHQKQYEKNEILNFIKKLNEIRNEHIDEDFASSYVINNISMLSETKPFECLKFQLNWTEFLPKINSQEWNGPIVVRSPEYLRKLNEVLTNHPNRIIHNSLLMLFLLDIIPEDIPPTPLMCTRSVISLMPEACSSLYMSQFSDNDIRDAIARSNTVFDLLKSHLKRLPIRGAALVRLASLKIQNEPWPTFNNQTKTLSTLDELEITSDNWFKNVLKIYEQRKESIKSLTSTDFNQEIWAYPIFAKSFYNSFSHKIAVPLSLILTPYFDSKLPHYLHYSTVGTEISKEILRSITKIFEDKTMRCVPNSPANSFSNINHIELLINSGAFQIAYHSMLAVSGSKAMPRLPRLNLTSTQLFFIVAAQEFCSKSQYEGIDVDSKDFQDIILWLFGQGGIASQNFDCKHGSPFKLIRNCGIW